MNHETMNKINAALVAVGALGVALLITSCAGYSNAAEGCPDPAAPVLECTE